MADGTDTNADDTDADTRADADASTDTDSNSLLDQVDQMFDGDLPEFAVPVAAGVILVLVLGFGIYAAMGDSEPAATVEMDAADAPDDPVSPEERIAALEAQMEELQTQVACNAAADDLTTGYCSQFVRGSQGTDDPTVERCGNTRDQRSSRYFHSASEMGCDWTEKQEDAGTVTVNGDTVDCVAEGYISPECPA